MNRKQALIVDDSKTAQYLLKRMLQKYDVMIDVVGSAEEALAYLSYNHPAVIFLDQQMTGMTGIEALKTIKANPHTALIPVIMYTSQNDDLFVSQAIALGAQGILSKSALQPSNLQQVLARLNFRSAEDSGTAAAEDDQAGKAAPEAPRISPAPNAGTAAVPSLDKVQVQVGRLFEIHIADVRSQISNSSQFIIKRLSANIEKLGNREVNAASYSLASVKSVVSSAMAAERRKKSLANRLLLAVMLAAMLLCGYLLLQMQADYQASSQKILAALAEKNAERPVLAATLTSSLASSTAEAAARPIHPALLQAISWSQNADFHFEHGEQPLSGARLSNLHQLLYLLAEGGYSGPLIVNISFGNFCLESDDANTFRLARGDLRASSCKMQKDLHPRFLMNDYITLQYQAFEKNLAPLQDGRISIRLVTTGINTASVEYPPVTPLTTAAEWNRAAQKNNRISVQFPQ